MYPRFALALALALAASGRVDADESLNNEMREQLRPAIEKIVTVMKEEKLTKIKLGAFIPPPEPASNPSAGVRTAVIAELRDAGQRAKVAIEIVDNAPHLTIDAAISYSAETQVNGAPTKAVIRVKFILAMLKGDFTINAQAIVNELQNKGGVISKPEVVGPLLGMNLQHKPNQTRDEKADQVERERQSCTASFHLDGTRVSARNGSPFAVEILVADEAKKPTKIEDWDPVKNPNVSAMPVGKTKDGKNPFVALKSGQTYAVKFYLACDFGFDAAVDLTIDGLSAFHFIDQSLRVGKLQDGKPVYRFYICPRGTKGGNVDTTLVIPGWYKTDDASALFVTREYGKGAVSKIPGADKGQIGVINVRIAGAWNKDEDPPKDVKGKNLKTGKIETEVGDPVKAAFQKVSKEIGVFNTTISIHYNHE